MREQPGNGEIIMGLRGSIFGQESSQVLIKTLKAKYSPSERHLVIRSFLCLERDVRITLAPSQQEEERWADAINVVTAVLFDQDLISSGNDLAVIESNLEESERNKHFNRKERQTYAQIYRSLRRILFPELYRF